MYLKDINHSQKICKYLDNNYFIAETVICVIMVFSGLQKYLQYLFMYVPT